MAGWVSRKVVVEEGKRKGENNEMFTYQGVQGERTKINKRGKAMKSYW